MTTIILPGIGGSGETHWQTLWERSDPTMVRLQPASWDAPVLEDWIRALDQVVTGSAQPPLLVAHSLGCLLVAHWAARDDRPSVRGAFLVASPDAESSAFPIVEAATFRQVPELPLPFPALMIASQNDPYATVEHSRRRAGQWRAGLVVLGLLGHINAGSDLRAWAEGAMLLEAFRAGTRA